MNSLFEKLSSYNIFNYLLPGIIFAVIAEYITEYNLIHDDMIQAIFFYYFYGLIISRFGSVIISPLYRKLKIVKFAEYYKYLEAVRRDEKILILNEENNMYRSFIALFTILLICKMIELIGERFIFIQQNIVLFLCAILLIIFSIAFRNQTSYIRKRIHKVVEEG